MQIKFKIFSKKSTTNLNSQNFPMLHNSAMSKSGGVPTSMQVRSNRRAQPLPETGLDLDQ